MQLLICGMHSYRLKINVGNGGADAGADNPHADLIMDASGNLYGTTYNGGTEGDATVFELVVPEPASAASLIIGSLALLRRTRRLTPRMVAE